MGLKTIFQDWAVLKIVAQTWIGWIWWIKQWILICSNFPFPPSQSGVLEQGAALEIGSGPKPYPSRATTGGWAATSDPPDYKNAKLGACLEGQLPLLGRNFGGYFGGGGRGLEGGGREGVWSVPPGPAEAAAENGQRETVVVCRRVCTVNPTLQTSLFEAFFYEILGLKRCHNFSFTIDTVQKKYVKRPTLCKIYLGIPEM